MDPHLLSQRLWQLLDRFPHKLLYRIGRAARLSVNHGTHKHDLIEALCALPEPALERAFVDGLARQDLQALCKRIGYASNGSQVDLAARILAAVDDPAVHAPRWRPFAGARAFAHRLELTSQKEWFAFVRGELPAKGTLPSDIPRYPSESYEKSGWTTWGDFLGTGNVAKRMRVYRPFHRARAYAQALGLASQAEWYAFVQGRLPGKGTLPPDIPAWPYQTYKKSGWTTWGDFLGTGFVATSMRTYRPFQQARIYARSLGLASQAEWYAFVQGRLPGKGTLPPDVPKIPHQAYGKAGWTTWGDFLGTGNVAHHQRTYRPFRQARAYARSLGLASRAEWQALCCARTGNRRTLPLDIPTVPERVYAGRGWAGYGDWLGTGRVRSSNYQYRSYADACAFVRALGIRTYDEWWAYCRGELSEHGRRPLDIPSNPPRAYREQGWVSWGDFFGTGNIQHSRIRRRSFPAMRAFVSRLGLPTGAEFVRAKRDGRIPKHIPTRIDQHPDWKGWADFLGPSYTGRRKPATRRPRKRSRRG